MDINRSDTHLGELFLDGWRPYLWILAIGLIVYLKTVFFDFSFFDDKELIVENKLFLSHIGNVFQAFCMKVYPKEFTAPYYRPILMVSFILNAYLGGISPFIYHLTNVFIHIAVSSLVYVLFQRLGYRKDLSFFAAVIFLVHPVLTQAVAWVPGRNDSLLAAFAIASFISFLNYIDRVRARDLLLHLFFFTLAIFTKESAVIILAMCYLYLILVKGKAAFLAHAKTLLAGQAAVCALWLIPRHFILKGATEVNIGDMWHLVVYQLPAVVQLIGKALFPVHQTVFPIMQDATCLYGFLTIALITILTISFTRPPYALTLFGAAWLVTFLLPPLIRPHAPVINDVLEHRLYMPIIGLMIMLAELDRVNEKFSFSKRGCAIAALGVILIFSVKTFFYSDNFRNGLVFWQNAVAGSPRSAFSHMKLGEVYYRDDRLDDALREIDKAIALDYQSTIAGHYYLGFIYLKKGMIRESEKEFRKTIALMPDNDWARMSLGVICYRTGRPEEAERLWLESFAISQFNFETAKNLALFYAEKKDFAKAAYFANHLRKLGIEPPADFLKKIQ